MGAGFYLLSALRALCMLSKISPAAKKVFEFHLPSFPILARLETAACHYGVQPAFNLSNSDEAGRIESIVFDFPTPSRLLLLLLLVVSAEQLQKVFLQLSLHKSSDRKSPAGPDSIVASGGKPMFSTASVSSFPEEEEGASPTCKRAGEDQSASK